MDSKLYVGNLTDQVTEEDLRTAFGPAGTIESVAIPTDRKTDRPRGFALIQMASADDAQKAISMCNGQSLHNQEMLVQISKPKTPAAAL